MITQFVMNYNQTEAYGVNFKVNTWMILFYHSMDELLVAAASDRDKVLETSKTPNRSWMRLAPVILAFSNLDWFQRCYHLIMDIFYSAIIVINREPVFFEAIS